MNGYISESSIGVRELCLLILQTQDKLLCSGVLMSQTNDGDGETCCHNDQKSREECDRTKHTDLSVNGDRTLTSIQGFLRKRGKTMGVTAR